MKYRPKINSIHELQDGDEFLVGEERWKWDSLRAQIEGARWFHGLYVVDELIQANVPVERDIPCPPGYELKRGDGRWLIPKGAQIWCQGRWENWEPNAFAASSNIHTYAIPIPIIEFVGELHKALQKFDPRTKVRVTVLEEGE